MSNTVAVNSIAYDVQEYVKEDEAGNLRAVTSTTIGAVPIINIPSMSDYTWQKRCLEDRLKHPDKYADRENLPETIASLRKWLAENKPIDVIKIWLSGRQF